MKLSKLAVAMMSVGFATGAYATNGMNMEGYGPIATGMGGASMAYDNGVAAAMNNPATLGMMATGSRLDVAIGTMSPDVSASNSAGTQGSDGDMYIMPAAGYIKKSGPLSYGVAMFAQGGMGAEYAAGSAQDQSSSAGVAMLNPMSPTPSFAYPNSDAHDQRSELGVGRLIFPVAYNVNDKLNVGGSLDYVWAGLDILWSLDARNFLGSMSPGVGADMGKAMMLGGMLGSQNSRATSSGSLVDTFINGFSTTGPGTSFGGPAANGYFWNFYYGDFQFSDHSNMTQKTLGTGWGGKLGFTYKVSDNFTVGGTYHTKTNLGDLKGGATMAFKVDLTDLAGGSPGASTATISLPSKVTVHDFQWPETFGLGVAYKPNERWLVAADWKRLNWADVMKDFNMTCRANDIQTDPLAMAFAGTELNFKYPQNWDDQNVIQLGVSYQATDALTLRAGINYAENPVPSDYLSPLFPATVERHYTFGLGYIIDPKSSFDLSLSFAPKKNQTETTTESNNLGATPATTVSHSQTNMQLMYSRRF